MRASDLAATLCQQVFPLVWVRQPREKALVLALALVLEFQHPVLEFQQPAEFLWESALALVSAREFVRGLSARLDLLGPKCDRPGPRVRVPKTAG